MESESIRFSPMFLQVSRSCRVMTLLDTRHWIIAAIIQEYSILLVRVHNQLLELFRR